MIGPMTILLPVTRKRGNPNWGKPIPFAPALPTEFELRVTQLHLTAKTYTSSSELRTWCEQNGNHRYVPEWLLEEWNITVDPSMSIHDRHFSGHTFHSLVL